MLPYVLTVALLCLQSTNAQGAPDELRLGNKPQVAGNNSLGYMGTCLKIFNRGNVPIRVNRWRDGNGQGRRAYLMKDEDMEFCGYNVGSVRTTKLQQPDNFATTGGGSRRKI